MKAKQNILFTTNPPQRGEKSVSMKLTTYQGVTITLEALQADEYKVTLVHQDKPAIKKQIDSGQLIKEIPYYQAKNREGYNVYFRPVGYQFVLLDDLSRENLPDLAKLMPCLLIETSPKNYQAWLRLRDIPQGREEAKLICRELAALLSADMGSAEPDHIGRLPGFTNRKPKHQKPNGLYPFVELKKWEYRVSTFSPLGGIDGKTRSHQTFRTSKGTRTRSHVDFNLCCMLINQGKTDEYIRQQLEATSEKAREEQPTNDYIGRTIRNARIKTGQ